jgi:ribosomal protein L16 Arg81 hydroxylase
MKILNSLFDAQIPNEFFSKHFTKMPFSMPDTAAAYSHLLNWDVVEKVLAEKKSVLRIVKDGVLEKDHAELDFLEAKKYHEKGHTLLLRYAEKSHPLLKELADDFSKSFRTEVDIQLYCTPEGNNAFGWHYDVEEVFIIQTQGSKLYTIRPNTIHPKPLLTSIPKDLQYEKEQGELQLQVCLQAGDWLYIPSGWWHMARTQSESMHISIGLMPRSALDIIGFLGEYLPNSLNWRTRFPVHKNQATEKDVAIYQEAFAQLGEDLKAKFEDPQFIQSFIEYTKNRNYV